MDNDGWGWDRMVNYRGYNEDIMKQILWMEEILHQLGTMKGTYEALQIMGLEWEKPSIYQLVQEFFHPPYDGNRWDRMVMDMRI